MLPSLWEVRVGAVGPLWVLFSNHHLVRPFPLIMADSALDQTGTGPQISVNDSKNHLSSLPLEIICHLFELCSIYDILHLRQVCLVALH